ncbi:MAG: hypothetical protein ACRDE5_13065 [Ginsengibacter sp.]
MKKILFTAISLFATSIIYSQTYPDPDFTNEPYYLKKNDSGSWALMRLEKGSSTMESKTKFGGFGGSESEYTIDGNTSPVRIKSGSIPSFIVSTGARSSKGTGSEHSDSTMRANGVDPGLIQQAMSGMMDPGSRFTLYKAESGGGQRTILLSKTHGGPFAGKKVKSSDKYTFSVKNIRDGYFELIPDKTLPPGEYVFTAFDPTGGSTRGPAALLFAFGIE